MSKEWECVYTRAECHHRGTKCSECPVTDLICDEFTECLDLSYEQGKVVAEEEHKKTCDTCIHKVSASDIKAIEESAVEKFGEWLNNNYNVPFGVYSAIEEYKKKTKVH